MIFRISFNILFIFLPSLPISRKLVLYHTGEAQLYLYDENGKKLAKIIKEHLDIDKTDMFKLAAVLTREADDKKIWDGNIPNRCLLHEVSIKLYFYQ